MNTEAQEVICYSIAFDILSQLLKGTHHLLPTTDQCNEEVDMFNDAK